MNPKMSTLLREGFSITTLENFSTEQINVLYERVKKSKGEVDEQGTPANVPPKVTKKSVTQIELPAGAKTNVTGNQSVSNVGGKTIITQTEGEMTEKSVSKKQHGLMGAAYSVEKGDKELKDIPKSYRGKVKKVVDSMSKKQVKDFAKTKTSKLPEKVETKESDDIKKLEESIMRLVEKHISTEYNKSDILKIINKR